MNEPWIIKFGEKEHLEQLLDGKILFHTLSYYRNYEEKENEKGRKDYFEGATEIVCPATTKSRIEAFGLPLEEILAAKNIAYIPKDDKYIYCFSSFTETDIIENKIISDCVLKNTGWEYVLLLKNPNDLVVKLSEVCGEDFRFGKVTYYADDQKDKNGLDEFHKDERFNYQKEFRLSFPVPSEYPPNIEKHDDDSCFVHFGKTEGFICKTSEFQEKISKLFCKQKNM